MLESVQKNKKLCYYKERDGCNKSEFVFEYFKSLSEEAEIERTPPALLAIWLDSIKAHNFKETLDFRKYKYTMVDDETFRKVKCKSPC